MGSNQSGFDLQRNASDKIISSPENFTFNMKKIFILNFSLLITAFSYQSCKPVDNTQAMMKADSTANAKLMMLSDSLRMACMTDVMNAAKMKADSMMMAMQSHGSSKGTK